MSLALLILFALLSVADYWTTIRALRIPGTYEAYPLGGCLFRFIAPEVAAVPIKLLAVGIAWYLLYASASGWLDVARWIVVALMFAQGIRVVWSNLRLIREG